MFPAEQMCKPLHCGAKGDIYDTNRVYLSTVPKNSLGIFLPA